MVRKSPTADIRREQLIDKLAPKIEGNIRSLIIECVGDMALFLAANDPDQLSSEGIINLFTAASNAAATKN